MSVDNRVVALADIAEGQWGLFTTAQARHIGMSAVQLTRLANEGVIERLRHGVYRVAGVPPTPEEQVRAAWLAIEPDKAVHERLTAGRPAVVSHRSAARIHQLGDADADVIEFTIDHRKQTRLPDIKYRRAVLGTGQWTLVGGLPITTVLKTIEDLAADQLDGGHLALVIRDAVTTDRVSFVDVAQALRPFAHKYGARLADSEGLLDRFLKEVGVSQSTRALSERVQSPGSPGFAALLGTQGSVALNDIIRDAFNHALVKQFSSPENQETLKKIVAQQVSSLSLEDVFREQTGTSNADAQHVTAESLSKEDSAAGNRK